MLKKYPYSRSNMSPPKRGRRTGHLIDTKKIRKDKHGMQIFGDYFSPKNSPDSSSDEDDNTCQSSSRTPNSVTQKNLGRRTGVDVLQGKNIRVHEDGVQEYNDYYSEVRGDESYLTGASSKRTTDATFEDRDMQDKSCNTSSVGHDHASTRISSRNVSFRPPRSPIRGSRDSSESPNRAKRQLFLEDSGNDDDFVQVEGNQNVSPRSSTLKSPRLVKSLTLQSPIRSLRSSPRKSSQKGPFESSNINRQSSFKSSAIEKELDAAEGNVRASISTRNKTASFRTHHNSSENPPQMENSIAHRLRSSPRKGSQSIDIPFKSPKQKMKLIDEDSEESEEYNIGKRNEIASANLKNRNSSFRSPSQKSPRMSVHSQLQSPEHENPVNEDDPSEAETEKMEDEVHSNSFLGKNISSGDLPNTKLTNAQPLRSSPRKRSLISQTVSNADYTTEEEVDNVCQRGKSLDRPLKDLHISQTIPNADYTTEEEVDNVKQKEKSLDRHSQSNSRSQNHHATLAIPPNEGTSHAHSPQFSPKRSSQQLNLKVLNSTQNKMATNSEEYTSDEESGNIKKKLKSSASFKNKNSTYISTQGTSKIPLKASRIPKLRYSSKKIIHKNNLNPIASTQNSKMPFSKEYTNEEEPSLVEENERSLRNQSVTNRSRQATSSSQKKNSSFSKSSKNKDNVLVEEESENNMNNINSTTFNKKATSRHSSNQVSPNLGNNRIRSSFQRSPFKENIQSPSTYQQIPEAIVSEEENHDLERDIDSSSFKNKNATLGYHHPSKEVAQNFEKRPVRSSPRKSSQKNNLGQSASHKNEQIPEDDISDDEMDNFTENEQMESGIARMNMVVTNKSGRSLQNKTSRLFNLPVVNYSSSDSEDDGTRNSPVASTSKYQKTTPSNRDTGSSPRKSSKDIRSNVSIKKSVSFNLKDNNMPSISNRIESQASEVSKRKGGAVLVCTKGKNKLFVEYSSEEENDSGSEDDMASDFFGIEPTNLSHQSLKDTSPKLYKLSKKRQLQNRILDDSSSEDEMNKSKEKEMPATSTKRARGSNNTSISQYKNSAINSYIPSPEKLIVSDVENLPDSALEDIPHSIESEEADVPKPTKFNTSKTKNKLVVPIMQNNSKSPEHEFGIQSPKSNRSKKTNIDNSQNNTKKNSTERLTRKKSNRITDVEEDIDNNAAQDEDFFNVGETDNAVANTSYLPQQTTPKAKKSKSSKRTMQVTENDQERDLETSDIDCSVAQGEIPLDGTVNAVANTSYSPPQTSPKSKSSKRKLPVAENNQEHDLETSDKDTEKVKGPGTKRSKKKPGRSAEVEPRRSNRNRVQPLAYWRNERRLYRYEYHTKEIVYLGIDPGTKDDMVQILPKKEKEQQKKKKPPKIPKTSVVNKQTGEEERVVLHMPFGLLEWLAPQAKAGEDGDTNAEYCFSNTFSSDGISFGHLKINPNAEKPEQRSAMHTVHFQVLKGHVKVTIHNTEIELQRWDTCIVPQHQVYSIQNLLNSVALLSFSISSLSFFPYEL